MHVVGQRSKVRVVRWACGPVSSQGRKVDARVVMSMVLSKDAENSERSRLFRKVFG